MRRLLAVSAALFFAVLGCDATPLQDSESPAAASRAVEDRSTIPQVFIAPDGTERIRRIPGVAEYIHYADDVMLPAHRTAAEYIVQKGDSYDDQRYAAPERHAITIAPVKTVRPMVEWEPMQAIMMGVPSYVLSAGSSNTLQTVVQIAKNAATVAEVWFVVPSTSTKNALEGALLAAGMSQQLITSQVRYMIQAIDSIWFIDYGPLPVLDTTAQTWSFVDFRYYHQRALDDGMPTWIGRNLTGIGVESNVNTYRMPVNIEGGTFQATTDGICFTGTRALTYMDCGASGCTSNLEFLPLSQVQQTGEAKLLRSIWGQYAGCKDVIPMYSITDDGTGHIDMFLKVLDDETVLIGDYRPPYANTAQQTNAARMDANAAFLEAYVKPNGKKFKVKRIIMPGHRQASLFEGATPFTYVNSTLINGLNLWPAFTFSDWEASRDTAQAEWEAALPDYEHVWIDSEELSFNSGAIHCITRTIPATTAAKWIADGSCSSDTCAAPTNGYSGDCTPNGIAAQVCYGPQWLCGCNDCDSACPGEGGASTECGTVNQSGCCDGNYLQYCNNDTLGGQVCPSGCGWNASASWYDCGYTGADPSGHNPRSCLPVVCTPSCAGKSCGSDGCGGSCGNCASGKTCTGGACVTSADPCGGVSFEGCCVGYTTLKWCEGGAVKQNTCSSGTCGWDATSGYYNCETNGQPDPSGVNPQSCPSVTCTPQCAGKVCGSDGCGSVCGACSVGSTCSAAGKCSATCTPSCSGKGCGPDGCGGNCGTCGAGSTCSAAGKCSATCTPSCSGKACGSDGCGGSCGMCSAGNSCNASGLCVAGCAPSCSGKVCGPDGCGGSCGTCAVGQTCTAAGKCLANCVPQCSGKACGDDGCGGACGTCGAGLSCTAAGKCTAGCAPNCSEKECGADGCGGICGTCGAGKACTGLGMCEATCAPLCTDKECGDDGCGGACGICEGGSSCQDGKCAAVCAPNCEGRSCGGDGCGGSCGACASGEVCDGVKCVVEACVPACGGKSCGANGCGGSCGACADGQACTGGQCEAVSGCGDITAEGKCDGSVVTWCQDEALKSFNCADQGRICGVKDGVGSTCLDPCVADCSGKQCGGDGCGGVCGSCPPGQTCSAGTCGDGPGPDAAPDSSGDTATPDAAPDAGGETDNAPDADAGTPEISGADADVSGGEVDVVKPVTGSGPTGCAGGGGDGSGAWLVLLAMLGLALGSRRQRRRGSL